MKKIVYLSILTLLPLIASSQVDSINTHKSDTSGVREVLFIIGGPGVVTEDPQKSTRFATEDDGRKNSVYAEFLGNGFAYSLNYERRIYRDEKLAISTRIGIAPGFIAMFTGFGLPLEANITFLRSPKGHMAEMGPGFTWFYGKSKFRNEKREIVNTGFYNVCDVTLRIGYKYVGPKGFLFRAAFIPTFAVVSPGIVRDNNFFPMGKTFTPWAGISVGYAFK